MSKRLFETLDIMNQNDDVNKTATCGVCLEVIDIQFKGINGTIKVGVPGEVALNVIKDQKRYRPILLIVDMDEYNKIKDQP